MSAPDATTQRNKSRTNGVRWKWHNLTSLLRHMFLARRPSPQYVDRFIAESSKLPLSYGPIGLARENHTGFDVDEHVAVVGRGEAAFERARRALAEWRHFDLGWVELFPAGAPIAPGTVVAVLR